MKEDKLLEDGGRLRREIDADYETLYKKLEELGSLKRSILAKENALRSIQSRLLASSGMPQVSDQEQAQRRRLIVATDDDDLRPMTKRKD